MTTLNEDTVTVFQAVMQSYIREAVPHIMVDTLRKIETEASAIEQEIWFGRGWIAGENSLLRWFADKVGNGEIDQFRAAQTLARGAEIRAILARIVQVIETVRPYAKPKRGRGRPRRDDRITVADLLVLVDALKPSRPSVGPGSGEAIRESVTQYFNAGKLAKTTTIEGHVKRLKRRLDAAIAALDKN